jgi:putative ABC transport system permease protein
MRTIVEALLTDVRQALRRITRSPGLSAIVILALTPPIVANTTIFSLLKATVLQKLPVPDPDALVMIEASDTRTNAYSAIYLPTYQRLKDQPGAFASLAAYTSSMAQIESGAVTINTGVEGVTPDYFTVLGVQPQFGRLIGLADDPLAAQGVISERLSLRLFGTADVAGRSMLVAGRPIEIIGVIEGGFTGIRMDGGDDLFLPIAYLRFTQSGDAKVVPRVQQIIGRLTSGSSVEAARAEVLGRWPAIKTAVEAELPAALRRNVENQQLAVGSFARGFSITRDAYGGSLTLGMALAVAMLAIGCVNLSALMLARGLTRQHEFAVRRALGVSRLRLFHQSAIDGVLLSLVAAILAFPLSRWASGVLVSMVSVAKAVPIGDVAPDWKVMALTTAGSMLVGVVISLLPARRAISLDMDEVLRGRGTAHRVRGPVRTILIVQVALSMILVVGAGLFSATLSNLYANELQHRDHQVVWTRLARSPLERGTALGQPYLQDLSERLAEIPGADAAAYSVFYPGYLSFFDGIPRDTVSVPGGAEAGAVSDSVSPGFFDLYSIALLRGRDFTWFDNATAPAVAIVNETLARQLSPSSDVVGRHVRVTSGQSVNELEIVGMVADANVTHIRDGRAAGLYRPLMQDMLRAQSPLAHVRVRGDLSAAQRGYVDAVNARRQHSVLALFTFDDWLDNAVVEQRLLVGMSGFAAVLAVSLSALGLFGLLAYSVSSRTREIGVRVSIGAESGDVAKMIMREGLLAVMPGLAIGIALALAVAWALRSQFYGVSPTDPRVIVAASFVVLVTATFASWLPARRAARIQPIEALRQD